MMGLIGIQYRHPSIYKLLVPIIHRKSVIATFKQEVGKNVSVQDIAAGFGCMAQYIDESNTYRGFDLNDRFVEYGQKLGLDIAKASIFDTGAYKMSDVSVLVDVVHHIPQDKLSKLFDLVFKHTTQRVIILEPAFLNLSKRYGKIAAPIDWLMRLLDSDGVNKIDRWLTEKEYMALFESRFGSIHGKGFRPVVKKVYPYYVVTFHKESA